MMTFEINDESYCVEVELEKEVLPHDCEIVDFYKMYITSVLNRSGLEEISPGKFIDIDQKLTSLTVRCTPAMNLR